MYFSVLIFISHTCCNDTCFAFQVRNPGLCTLPHIYSLNQDKPFAFHISIKAQKQLSFLLNSLLYFITVYLVFLWGAIISAPSSWSPQGVEMSVCCGTELKMKSQGMRMWREGKWETNSGKSRKAFMQKVLHYNQL